MMYSWGSGFSTDQVFLVIFFRSTDDSKLIDDSTASRYFGTLDIDHWKDCGLFYPLVNIQKAMENHHFYMGKSCLMFFFGGILATKMLAKDGKTRAKHLHTCTGMQCPQDQDGHLPPGSCHQTPFLEKPGGWFRQRWGLINKHEDLVWATRMGICDTTVC